MNSRALHRKMPTRKKLLEYWEDKLDVCQQECFACGSPFNLERCHIKPSVFGGDNSFDNIHVLCTPCHKESEGVKLYDAWFSYKRKNEWQDPVKHMFQRIKKYGFDDEKIKEIGKEFDYDGKKTIDHIMSLCYYK